MFSEVILVFILLPNIVYTCFWNNFCPYRYFGNKTPYHNGRGDIRDHSIVKDCEAVSIWGLFRHGQRNKRIKSANDISVAIALRDELISSHEDGKGSLCVQDIENLRNWQINAQQKTKDVIYYELARVGQRFKEAFKNLLEKLEPNTYTFKASSRSYMSTSMNSFISGLEQPSLYNNDSKSDFIKSPADDCKRYIELVRGDKTLSIQSREYQTTAEYLKSQDRILRRAGLTNLNITFLYDLCRYSWLPTDNKASPWCALFDEEDLKIQEYREDLLSFNIHGYGHPLNVEFGEVPLGDLLKTFRLEKEKPQKKITAYFSRGSLLMMTCSALGPFKDETPLTAEYRDVNRKWRSSQLGLFGGSLVAVLNKCKKEPPNDYVVSFYINENRLESICNHGVCTWEEFEKKLQPSENKTFDNVCHDEPHIV